MAISDTLSDAAFDIRAMLANQPAMYEPVRGRIEALLTEMDSLRAVLDTPPYNDPTGPWANAREVAWADASISLGGMRLLLA